MQRRLVGAIGLLVITLGITSCDTHKAERASLRQQVEGVEGEISRSNDRLGSLNKDVESLSAEVTQATDRLQQHEQRLTDLQDELAKHLLNHKMATVALMATAGGAATIINENIDEDTKSALRIVGVIGALYCIGNSDECADVAARIVYYGSQIDAEKKSIAAVTSTIAASKQALQKRQAEQTSLKNFIANKTNERDALKKKHDDMMCSLCF